MKYPKLLIATVLLLALQLGQIQAQIQKGKLAENVTITSELAPGERHQYKVRLDKDRFAFFRLMQQGVDVMVTTYKANGEKIESFDSPNGKQGPELFTLTSDEAADYMIEVAPFDKNEPRGKYELKIEKISRAAVSPSEKVDQLFTAWDNKESPGAAVAIVKEGAIVYKKGYGMANLEYDIPISSSTVFHIASVSKQFTAFSILLLEQEGKLSLDDDIRKYIPEVPDFGKKITLRHLATHTSGLRDQWELLIMAGWRMDDVITTEHILKMVSRQKELNFNPGEEFSYCNTGFTLLAEVVKRVSGKTFPEFTQEHIFKPLKMSHTLFYDDHERIVKNRAYSYHTDSSGYKKSVLNYANAGATSLFTTAEDLSLWAMNFASMKVGNEEVINKMNTLAVLNNGKTFGGALGQFKDTYKGLDEIQHGGADAGYRSFLTRFPNENLAVVVLSNSADFNPGSMAHKIVDVYLAGKLKPETSQPVKKSEAGSQELKIDPNLFKAYVGEYEVQPGIIMTISENEGRLYAQATGQSIDALIPVSQTKFKAATADATMTFITAGGKPAEQLQIIFGNQTFDATRIKPFDPSAVKLAEFTGRYFSEELATEYQLTEVNRKLTIKHSRLSDIELNPVKKDTFSGFMGNLEFTRDSKGVISGYKISTGRIKNLKFNKIK
ncbi:serine hydrolase [Flavihumibacter sp. R14]|nr:serine hydrolase [Flavihumibacter soli]